LPRAEKALVYASIMTQGKYKGGAPANTKTQRRIVEQIKAAKGI
jgi:hypothetical protein